MSDLNSRLESELSRHLRTVPAPDGLWQRIQLEQRNRRSPKLRGWVLWPALVAVCVVSGADLGWQMTKARGVTAAPRLAAVRMPETRRGECLSCHVQGL